jgi:hypothetical protein
LSGYNIFNKPTKITKGGSNISLTYAGAHVINNNQGNVGIAFLGGYTNESLSSAIHNAVHSEK